MLEMYDRHMQEKLAFLSQSLDAVIAAQRRPAEIKKRGDLLSRKYDEYIQKRGEFVKMLPKSSYSTLAKRFKDDTDMDYIPLTVKIPRRKLSPRTTLKRKQQQAVLKSGGPIHPDLLPNYSTKKTNRNFRKTAKLSQISTTSN